ncbi:hypothetical protein ACWGRF_07940 [Streptomyces zhihengii]
MSRSIHLVEVGLLSDGPLHTAELLGLVAGLFLFADLVRRRLLARAGFASSWA